MHPNIFCVVWVGGWVILPVINQWKPSDTAMWAEGSDATTKWKGASQASVKHGPMFSSLKAPAEQSKWNDLHVLKWGMSTVVGMLHRMVWGFTAPKNWSSNTMFRSSSDDFLTDDLFEALHPLLRSEMCCFVAISASVQRHLLLSGRHLVHILFDDSNF